MRLTTAFAALLMLVLYTLPWLVNPGVSLTPGAYDLAEWASLHPAVRAETPALLTSFLLRLPLACVALLIAFSARGKRLVPALAVLLIAAALLPPLEFVRALGDANYQQQFALALITLVGSAIGLSRVLARWHRAIMLAVTITGAAASALGLFNAYQLMRGFDLPVQIGFGGVMLALTFAVLAASLPLRGASARPEGVQK